LSSTRCDAVRPIQTQIRHFELEVIEEMLDEWPNDGEGVMVKDVE
jgi:hypothetical protein